MAARLISTREVETDAGGQVLEFVMNRQARTAGGKLDRLPEPDRMAVDTSRPFHHERDALDLALNFREIRPVHEIAELGLAAGDQVVQGHVDGIEMIDQRLARIPVVDEQAVEARLFEGDSLGGCVACRRALLVTVAARRLRGRRRDKPRVDDRALPARWWRFPARRARRCAPPAPGRTQAISRSFSRRTSWRASRLKSPTSSSTRGPTRPSASSSAL